MRRIKKLVVASAALITSLGVVSPSVVHAEAPVDGAGSTWSQIAVDQWRADVARQGLVVNYQGVGSTAGRVAYYQAQVDFAVSEIPFQSAQYDRQGNLLADETQLAASRPYAYLPVVAGGTAFMYNLKANGQRITDLRLSPETAAKIFTGQITMWNDPLVVADNPQRVMPATRIKPVVRSDGWVQLHKSLLSWLRKLPAIGISCARRPTWVRRAPLLLSTQIFRIRDLLRNSSLMELPTLSLLNTTMVQSPMLNTVTPKNVAFLLRQSRMHLAITHNRQQ